MRTLRRPRAKLGLLVALCGLLVLLSPVGALGATGTVYVKGTVTCPAGEKFVGAWVNSTGGGSGWATNRTWPATNGQMAKVSRKLSPVALPTTVTLNVGCGGETTEWKYVYDGQGKVVAAASGTVFVNLGCNTSRCIGAPRGVSGSTTQNPATDASQCTYRASAFWREMTGSFPAWGGNAGQWDDAAGAPSRGWQVRSWPEPDSLMIWQPNTNSAPAEGHVAYVADIGVASNGKRQVKIYDRNWRTGAVQDSNGFWNRSAFWLDLPSGVKFIRVPPRYTSRVR